MKIAHPTYLFFIRVVFILAISLSACSTQPNRISPSPESPPVTSVAQPADVIVYASEIPESALRELSFYEDAAATGGKFIGLQNNGDELDPPPENDPHVTFTLQVQGEIPYRCWIHMKVGAPKGRSQANKIWVQLSNARDTSNQEILSPGSNSYLTSEGPLQEGWTWVGCNHANSTSDSLIYFRTSGEITVRLQAGAEGVGFDQFLLSPASYLDAPPSQPIVPKE